MRRYLANARDGAEKRDAESLVPACRNFAQQIRDARWSITGCAAKMTSPSLFAGVKGAAPNSEACLENDVCVQNDFFLSGLQRSSWTFSSMSLSMAIPNRDRVKTRVLGNLRYWQNDRDD